MACPKFAIFKDHEHLYYFRLFDDKGSICLTGNTYGSHSECVYAIQTLLTLVLRDRHYLMLDEAGNYYFQLVTSKRKIIGTSRIFRTWAGREWGIALLKKNAPIADWEDYSRGVRYFRQD